MWTRPHPAPLLRARDPRRCVGLPLGVAVGLFATACSGTAGDQVASGAATQLAEEAETLAAHLERDDPCSALDQADLLLVRAHDGHANGEVSDEMVDRVEHVAGRVLAEFECAESATDDPTDDGDGSADSETNADDKPAAKPNADDKPAAKPNADDKDNRGQGNGGEGRGKAEGRG